MEYRTVFLAFYKVTEQWDQTEVWQTRLSRILMGPYVHVDVMFSDGWTTSICSNGTVFFEPRTLRNTKKKMLAINVTHSQEHSMRKFASQCMRTNVPFNHAGFYRCAFPLIWRRCTDDRFFCSEYVLRLLQHAGHFREEEPGTCHPTKLFTMLSPYAAATANPMLVGKAILSTSGFNAKHANFRV
jgi:hypothetical protein